MDDDHDLDNVLIESMDETQILSSLLWVSELIGSTTDIDELLQLIVELTPKLINLNRCTIFLWDNDKKEFVPRISYSPEREEREAQIAGFYALRIKPMEISELANKLMDEKVPVVVKDAQKSTMIPKKYVEFFDIKSILFLPLLCKGEFIGLMSLDHVKDIHHFTQKEIRVAMGLATHAALAIRNAQLISSLRAEKEKSNKIIETMPDGLLVISPEHKVAMTNSAMEHLTGLTTHRIVGHSCKDIFKHGITNGDINYCESNCPIANISENPAGSSIEGCIVTKDNKIKWISSNYSPVLDIDGNLLYTVVAVRDITGKKKVKDKSLESEIKTHRKTPKHKIQTEFIGRGF